MFLQARLSGTLAFIPKGGEQKQNIRHTYSAIAIDIGACAIRSAAKVREQEKHIRYFDRAVAVDVFRAANRITIAVEAVSSELACSRIGCGGVVIASQFLLAAGDFICIAHPIVIAIAVDYAAGAVGCPAAIVTAGSVNA